MAYNITRCFIQFILPMLIVFAVYASIYIQIKNRPISQPNQVSRPNAVGASPRNGLASPFPLDPTNSSRSMQGSFSCVDSSNNIISQRCVTMESRRRRANIMIISIAVVFFLSWLPLNSINLALEISPDLFGDDNVLEGNSRDLHTIGTELPNITSYTTFKLCNQM